MTETFGKLSVGARKVEGVKKFRPKDRHDWLAGRGKTVGMSDLPALFGVHDWKTALELYGEKKGLYTPQFEQTVVTPTHVKLSNLDRGNMQEGHALRLMAMAHPEWSIEPNPIPGGIVFVDEDARMSSTPDSFIYCRDWDAPATAQIKTVDPFAFKKKWFTEDGAPEPPLYVQIQAIGDASLSGCTRAFVGALAGWDEFYLWEIGLHPALMKKARELVADFWRRVAENDPYPPDYARDGEVLAALRGDPDGREIDLTTNNRIGGLIERRDVLKVVESEGERAKKERKLIDTEIKDILAGASRGRLADGRVIQHSIIKRGAYSVEASQYDRLDVKAPKGAKAAPAAVAAE